MNGHHHQDARLIGGESRGHLGGYGGVAEVSWVGQEVAVLSATELHPLHMGSRTLNCLIEGESNVFVVRVWPEVVVSELKESIQSERAKDGIKDIDPHTLELWKVSAIDEPLCEMTLLFSAQGLQLYRRQTQGSR